MQVGHNKRPWFGATAVGDGAELHPHRRGGQPSLCSDDVAEVALLKQQIDTKVAESLSATLCRLSEHFSVISDRVFTMSPHDAEALLAQAVEALISVSRSLHPGRRSPSGRNQPLRFTVEKFIETRLSSPDMSPVTIARDLEIPRSTLYKAFVDVGGIAKYIQDRRLVVAMSLLLRQEECRSLGQIASSLGFANSATFSKAFRKRFGRSPRSVRAFGTEHAACLRRSDEGHAAHESHAA